ncbi:Cytoskeletal signaling protein slm1 [Ceratocystis platani]|uniref:Cytoskeletal signaling protein slm1 n=1 Tax=Ceratocystis fimbriata f. sp. platani TaxID=88771 RepID=A0A0F8D4J0_CERFI|nr:Cytoskeletal signaling protein slm1 [Ceratocystis platani]
MASITQPASPPGVDMPIRTSTGLTGLSGFSDDAIPEADPNTTAGLLAERLQAWKHAVVYLEDYITAVEKIHKAHAKEYEKALKTIANPLREGHHFDADAVGFASFFENIRLNTQAIVNTNLETEKSLKDAVLPILERLHKEIKLKVKELANGVGKGAKDVEKARGVTQKQIELLGQQTASYESAGARVSGHDDPYVVRRGVAHRLHKQVQEENNHRNELISVQANFCTFEAHIMGTISQTIEAFTGIVGGQGENIRMLHTDMLGAVQRVPVDFEWRKFQERCADRLINPNDPPRAVDSIVFPNMKHPSTQPVVEGLLERKSRNKLSWGHASGYYVITPSKYLHEFRDTDDVRADPKPELSIYLPDAVVSPPSGEKFSVKGKDISKNLSSKLTGSSELNFKASSAAEAQRWYEAMKDCATAGVSRVNSLASPAMPSSPVVADMKVPVASPTTPSVVAATQEAAVTGEKVAAK